VHRLDQANRIDAQFDGHAVIALLQSAWKWTNMGPGRELAVSIGVLFSNVIMFV
jgi:hypothetical protein